MWRRTLTIAGAGFGLLFIILALVITAPPGVRVVVAPIRAWLVQSVAQRLSDGMNGTLDAGVLEGSLLRAPSLSGVVLRDHTGAAVIRIEAVRLRYAPLSLLRGVLVIHEVEVTRPFVTLLQTRDGTLNLARLALPTTQPAESLTSQSGILKPPFGIEVRRFTVKDGRSRLALGSLKGVTALSDVQVALAARADDTGLHLTIQEAAAQTHPARVKVARLQGTVRWTMSQLHIEQLQLHTGNTRAGFNMLLPHDADAARITLRLNPLDVQEVGSLIARDDLRGELFVDLRAQGSLDDIGFHADLSADAGRVKLEGRLNTAEHPARYGGRVSVQGLNLATLANREALRSDLNMVLDVEGRGLSPRTIEGRLDVSVQPSHLGGITLDDSRIRMVAQSERIRLEAFELISSLASVSATGSLDFQGTSDIAYEARADLSQLQPLLGIDSLRGSLQLRGSATGVWPDLDATGTLIAADAALRDNGFQSLQLDYQASQLGTIPAAAARLQLRNLVVGELPIETAELQADYEGSQRQVTFTSQLAHPPQMQSRLGGRLTLGNSVTQAVIDTVELRFGDRTWRAPRPLDIVMGPRILDIRYFALKRGDESVSLTGRIENRSMHGLRLEASSIDLTYLSSKLGLYYPAKGRASLVMQAAVRSMSPCYWAMCVSPHRRQRNRRSTACRQIYGTSHKN